MSALAEKLMTEAGADTATGANDHQAIHEWGRQRLMQHGFPDLKTEQWKYTPLRVLEKRDFQNQTFAVTALPSWPVEGVVLHFDHGVLSIDPATLPEGVTLSPTQPQALKKKDYDQIYGQREGAFAWLNLAQFEQAWHLEITGEQTVIIATTTSGAFEAQVHPRMVIDIAPNASLKLIEHQHDLGQGLINTTCEINVADGAKVEHLICRQNAESVWIQRTDVNVAKDADYRVVAFDQGGRLTRHDLKVHIQGGGANGEIDGLVLLNGRQHVDWHTEIAHCVGQTNSREAFRFLADGSSVGVLNGRIHIHADSDDSHSDLNTANLLLSDDARINIKPELEIYSEEVTASHGATIGQLDDRSLFYMQSRGLSEAESLALLKYGFAAEPMMQIQTPAIRDWVLDRLKEVL